LRRVLCLSLAVALSCTLLLAATVLAQPSGFRERLGWMIPYEVSVSGNAASRGPDLEVNVDGNLHLIWMDDKVSQPDLYYTKSTNQGNDWSALENLSTTPASYQGALALGASYVVHVCWWEQLLAPHELLYARRLGGMWGGQVTVVVTDSEIQEPSIVEGGDYIHLIWSNKLSQNFDLFYTRRGRTGGAWDTPTCVTDTASTSLYTRMATDGNGNLHAVWQENSSPNEILYISGTVAAEGTAWSDAVTLTEGLATAATSPDIVLGEDDMVHVVLGADTAGQLHTQDLYYVSFPISSTEDISPTIIPGSRVLVSQQLPTFASPSIALAGSDEIHVVWNGIRDDDLWDRIYYAVSHDGGGSWSQAMPISPNDAWPDGFAAVDTDGTLVHVAWQQKELGNDNDIYYAHSLPIVRHFGLGLKEY